MRRVRGWTLGSVVIGCVVFVATGVRAQPAPMGTRGCCCVVRGESYTCTEKTQADCLAEQPGAPTYPKHEDWKKAWEAGVKASQAQAARPSRGGWIAGPCEK